MRIFPDKTPEQVAQEAQDLLQSVVPEVARAPVTKNQLVDLGSAFWEHSYKGLAPTADVDLVAEERLVTYLQQDLMQTDQMSATLHLEMLKIPNNYIVMMGSCRWCDQAFPIVRLGHKRAAALMATNISKDNLPNIRMPWAAFVIELPSDLLSIQSDGNLFPVSAILVHQMGPSNLSDPLVRWTWLTITGHSISQWQISESLEQLLGHVEEPNAWKDFGAGIDDDYDVRISHLIGRLIAATCLMMSDPTTMKERTERYKVKGQKRPNTDAPSYRVFTEGKPINIDARPAIRDYLEGKKPIRNAPNVRTLVCGHFKPKLGARLGKQVWLEPYWRGGTDTSPIIKRSHSTE